MLKIDDTIHVEQLRPRVERMFELSARKIRLVEEAWDSAQGAPVYTIDGVYTTRGWTEWTQGFRIGSSLLQFEATGERSFLDLGKRQTRQLMPTHITQSAVHEHGFNNVSTYGNLLRMMNEGRIEENEWEREYYELALKASGAVQASRWTSIADGRGFICSFNGPHSLYVDAMRTLRALAWGHRLGHVLLGEQERRVSLLDRLVLHCDTNALFNVYYGEGRDNYDVRGRVAHETIFNLNDGSFRSPATQQGYSPFSTWTRGLAWTLLGFAEQLEFLKSVPDQDLEATWGRASVEGMMLRAALAMADFHIDYSPTDGVPYWDTGAPELHHLGDYLSRPADPFNDWEPVDSSAAAIAAQGMLRLGRYLRTMGADSGSGERYRQAGLTMAAALLNAPYLSEDEQHQGLLLHIIYNRPGGWDHIPQGSRIPRGESSMFGDYHLRELGLMLLREARGEDYLTFFGPERGA